MSNFGGPYSLFEKDFANRFAMAQQKITKRTIKIQALMQKASTMSATSLKEWNVIRVKINYQYRMMLKEFQRFALFEVPARFNRSIAQMTKRINNLKSVTKVARLNPAALINTVPAKQIKSLLYQDAIVSMNAAIQTGKKNVTSILTKLQTNNINNSLSNVLGGVSNAELLTLQELEMIKAGRFVQAGRYKYKAEYYARMVGRVKFHEAHSTAALSQARNYDTDLVIVSSHNTTTSICLPFEGKVFSINGRDKRFPVLDLYPPFHPNCLHLIYPQFVEGMEAQGSLKQFEDFSKGATQAPPYPASFIPIDERILL